MMAFNNLLIIHFVTISQNLYGSEAQQLNKFCYFTEVAYVSPNNPP